MKCTIESHELNKRDRSWWYAQQYAGHMTIPSLNDEPAEILECRHCTECGSTLAREVGR